MASAFGGPRETEELLANFMELFGQQRVAVAGWERGGLESGDRQQLQLQLLHIPLSRFILQHPPPRHPHTARKPTHP